jgi:protein-S-isoprenylcysteine O-methyltransferase Ste14
MMPVLALALFATMFLVIFVARTAVQKRRTGDSGIRAGGLEASPGSIEWWAGWMLVAALVAAVAAPIAEMAGLAPWIDATWVRAFGAAIAVVGIAATFLAQLSMGDQWRIGIDADEETDLVISGAFAVVRNPIFSAMILAYVGLALMVPNPISVAGVALLVAAVELQVRSVEEPYLRRVHPVTYPAYVERVGRLIPLVGRG